MECDGTAKFVLLNASDLQTPTTKNFLIDAHAKCDDGAKFVI